MSFLGSSSVKERLKEIIPNGNPENVVCGAYELSVGDEFCSSGSKSKRYTTTKDKFFVLEQGHFAVMITEEIVTIPNDLLGLISVRNRYKSRGLVNISGFHVDPGYSGRIKFSVYNAGGAPIRFEKGSKAFLIWFASFDQSEENPYVNHSANKSLTVDDIDKIKTEVTSLSALNCKLQRVEDYLKIIILPALIALLGVVVKLAIFIIDRM